MFHVLFVGHPHRSASFILYHPGPALYVSLACDATPVLPGPFLIPFFSLTYFCHPASALSCRLYCFSLALTTLLDLTDLTATLN